MGDLPLPVPSAPGVLSRDAIPMAIAAPRPNSPQPSDTPALLGVLRQAVTAGTLSTEAILNAIADAARVLSGAHGTAIASRVNGSMVCRARSGDIAPELGAPLNTDSGISGECLRTATILVCKDSSTDERVDPEVCRALGIRSIAVVPLRGRMGMLGILEAFSEDANAFEDEQINWLRALAEIAEMAYERERRAPVPASMSTPAAIRPALFAPPSVKGEARSAPVSDRSASMKRYWIVGAVAVVLILTAMVVRLSWRQTGAEIAASEPHPQPVSTVSQTASTAAQQNPVLLKPDASVPIRKSDRSQSKDLLRKASEVEPAEARSQPSTPVAPPRTTSSANATSKTVAADATPTTGSTNTDSEAPPSIEIAAADNTAELARLASTSATMPSFGAPVSQGVVEGHLIHRVDPIYPAQARFQGLTGSVILEAAIGADGSVRNVKIVSGPAMLADAAKSAVERWRYSAALLDGKPVETQKQITVVFRLP
ncbi:MAG: TonB family protein [Candidatus Sulfotelmatobacter sp.]